MAQNENSPDTEPSGGVKSVRTLFSILERMKTHDRIGVSDLAREMEMSKGAVHRYLQTLVDEGYAVNEDGTYSLSMRFLDYGAHVKTQYPFNEYIQPKVRRLADQTGERAQYIVEEHGRGIYLHRERGANAVETDARVGKVVYLHTTAAGKAILSQLPRDRVEKIIDEHGLITQTDRSVADRDELFAELTKIRDRGFALNEEEHVRGLFAVGVPITTQNGDVLGGLSVSGPANRLKDRSDDQTIQRKLLGIKDEIELNLSYS
jgi:DNA-binding IclR family transcriptional regulator